MGFGIHSGKGIAEPVQRRKDIFIVGIIALNEKILDTAVLRENAA